MNKITQAVSMQVYIMFILVVVGYVLTKKNIISRKGSADISNILLTIVTPSVLIRSYQMDINKDLLFTLGIAFVVSIAIHIIVAVIAKFYFFSIKDEEQKILNSFGGFASNCGFMGIPLLSATLGSQGVFFGSAYLAVFNCFVWTYGIHLFNKGKDGFDAKKLVLNPGIIGTAIAMLLFFFQIRLPEAIGNVVGYVADLNTPLAMLLLGSFLGRVNLISTFKQPKIYAVSFLRLIISPAIAIIILALVNADVTMSLAVIIAAACPIAAIGAIFAEKYDMDAGYCSQIASISTVYSLITIPLMVYIATIFIK